MNRIIPDAVKAWQSKIELRIRNPQSTRPWQHVLEPLRGYLLLGAFISNNRIKNDDLSSISFNFGPRTDDVIQVEEVIKLFAFYWDYSEYIIEGNIQNPEASLLNLSYDKAANILEWRPKLNTEKSLKLTADWYLAQQKGTQMLNFSIEQIKYYWDL